MIGVDGRGIGAGDRGIIEAVGAAAGNEDDDTIDGDAGTVAAGS